MNIKMAVMLRQVALMTENDNLMKLAFYNDEHFASRLDLLAKGLTGLQADASRLGLAS
jgi:hypothetical protein